MTRRKRSRRTILCREYSLRVFRVFKKSAPLSLALSLSCRRSLARALSSNAHNRSLSLALAHDARTTTALRRYDKYIFYTVITSVVALERDALKEKVVSTPEILAELVEQPVVAEFLNALYECRYRDFMVALVDVERLLRADRFLVANASTIVRSMRIAVYAQFLSSCVPASTSTRASTQTQMRVDPRCPPCTLTTLPLRFVFCASRFVCCSAGTVP